MIYMQLLKFALPSDKGSLLQDLRLTNQELRQQLAERQDEASL